MNNENGVSEVVSVSDNNNVKEDSMYKKMLNKAAALGKTGLTHTISGVKEDKKTCVIVGTSAAVGTLLVGKTLGTAAVVGGLGFFFAGFVKGLVSLSTRRSCLRRSS